MKGYSLSKKEKKTLGRIIAALALFIVLFAVDKTVVLGSVFRPQRLEE